MCEKENKKKTLNKIIIKNFNHNEHKRKQCYMT